MVVDPPERHLREGVHPHVQVARVAVTAEAAFDVRRVRELGGAAEAAVAGVEGAAKPRHRVLEGLGAQGGGTAAPARLGPGEGVAQRLVLLRHLVPVGGEEVHDPHEEIAERGEAVARRRREVGAAEEGGEIARGEEHRERPATGAPREELVRHLVDLVEVGALLPVHLDVDEVGVHDFRGGLVLERLVGHHVAPVASGIADREEDRTVLRPRPLKGFRPPRVPVHRVVRVLQKIWARLGGEAVPAGLWRGHDILPGGGAGRGGEPPPPRSSVAYNPRP